MRIRRTPDLKPLIPYNGHEDPAMRLSFSFTHGVAPKSRQIVTLFLLVFGTIFVAIGLATCCESYWFVRHSVSAQGNVIELRLVTQTDSDGQESTGYAPVFTFIAQNGNPYTAISRSNSNPPQYKVGDSITVLYEPDNPSRARIDSFLDLWFLPVIFGGIGAAFICISTSMELLRRRKCGSGQFPVAAVQ